MNTEQRLQYLENKVIELLAWKTAKMQQQISFPLDQASRDIINKDHFVWTGVIAEVPPLVSGAICTLNGAPIAVHVEAASDYT